jgi:hypothetical protein
MDNREDSAAFNDLPEVSDPVLQQLAAIRTRLSLIEAAITLRNGRHRQRAGASPTRMLFAFGFGLLVGIGVAVLVKLLW